MLFNYLSKRNTSKCFFASITFLFFIISGIFSTLNAQKQSLKDEDLKSTFSADLINIETSVDQVFRYTTTLQNNATEDQIYQLTAKVPEGWKAIFKAKGKQVTSIKIDRGKKEIINLEFYPSHKAKPEKYKVPVLAESQKESLNLNLEAVVSGAYELKISTPTGRLSDKITEGENKEIQLNVKNTGSLSLTDIELNSKTPPKWSVSYKPSKIDRLSPGETETITAILTVPDKTIAGDYMTTFTAKNANTKDQAVFRISVVTSLASGLLGAIIIVIAIMVVYALIRKYGRR
ncbi:COG1470 family protein [Gaetbulibacter saemankumensis]|uniref:COG1470 family protein n=1 Tax=Gaetbulibacter saemankumensis TaxID=311208 RepID=UPI000409F510|nr:NEW3 domain-containing protein [Gaetbulibacter saemankumensis]